MTGRILGELGLRTRRVVYGEPTPSETHAELALMTRIDQAHLVMLTEQSLIPSETARALLDCIAELVAARFAPLQDRPAPRGLYLMYEGYLIERLGLEVGGVLHSGRSRNDLKATVTSLRLREWLLDFAAQAARLEAILLSRARAYQSVVMPIYTHFQAALPISFGYYLLGVALAIGREVEALWAAAAGLLTSPLGAGAVAGTDLPIDPARTADLLGFAAPAPHALDAVASRDVPLRLLGTAAGTAVVLSRLATDLQLWSTAEFGFVNFPDRLVGGSSAMPQKRNAFLLEHVKAKPGQALGAWAGAAAMMAATPFTNSIEVGTEAVAGIWPGLAAAEQAVLLSQVLVSGARPDAERMGRRAEDGFTTATAVANRLVLGGMPFRAAHQLVGAAVREAIESGSTRLAGSGPYDRLAGAAHLEPAELVADQRHGGGPGAFAESFRQAGAAWAAHRDRHLEWRRSITAAETRLADAVERLRRGAL